ncbi:MAG: hypothetical protein KGS00_00405 [Alphaproteobacteria bacterium]|nr:hypothetical protein [Alphaproteobacteria bacterium]
MSQSSPQIDPSFVRLQLDFAWVLRELIDAPLADILLPNTQFHRLLGLGRPDQGPAEGWRPIAEEIDRLDASDTVEAFLIESLRSAPPPAPDPNLTLFGCFACEKPNASGGVRIHFTHRDPRPGPGPLSRSRLHARRADLISMIDHLTASEPLARTIEGASWLYNTEAYRRIFPADYVSSLKPKAGPRTLTGYSYWGQFIDHQGRLKSGPAHAFRDRFSELNAEAPWQIFPYQALLASAPLASFSSVSRSA